MLYNNPNKVVLKGNLSLVRKGARVTGDSGIYFPATKRAMIMGNASIVTEEGNMQSEVFYYDMTSKVLSSSSFTRGNSKGISFQGKQMWLYPGTKNMKLSGNALWENDSLRGTADTIFLNKSLGFLQMTRKARIEFKKKKDEVKGSFIELDLNTSKISRIEGSQIQKDELVLKAKNIRQNGENYELKGDVVVASLDSAVRSAGTKALIRKAGMDMQGPTITRVRDKEGKDIFIHAPQVRSDKKDNTEKYHFHTRANIRGSFEGYSDSIYIEKTGKNRHIYLYRNSHLQNDSLYIEADTLELIQDSITDIILARRNAMMIMITKPNRVNTITAAYIELKKNKDDSELFARGESESWLWNDEKSNVGINNTVAPSQKARILNRKISKVSTKGNSTSKFQPIQKIDYSFEDRAAVKLKEAYATDSLSPGLMPVPHFLDSRKKKQ